MGDEQCSQRTDGRLLRSDHVQARDHALTSCVQRKASPQKLDPSSLNSHTLDASREGRKIPNFLAFCGRFFLFLFNYPTCIPGCGLSLSQILPSPRPNPPTAHTAPALTASSRYPRASSPRSPRPQILPPTAAMDVTVLRDRIQATLDPNAAIRQQAELDLKHVRGLLSLV